MNQKVITPPQHKVEKEWVEGSGVAPAMREVRL
jgi:hypothetical protein